MLTRLKQLLGLRSPQVSVLMVCTANICRSPMAQGLLAAKAAELGWSKLVRVDSAGLHVAVGGQRPDVRAQGVCNKADVDIARQRSRKVTPEDFLSYDYILAMDNSHLEQLIKQCPEEQAHKILAIMSFHPDTALEEIPDPYFGNQAGFEHVFGLLDDSMPALLTAIQSQLTLDPAKPISESP
ncbi:low molecular weight phosphotyrosine protein phosphatase [Halieaceae bacterium IMCC14734]|uniref:protein-tyrosine-phosphatase n=1 Tax=Candidatus Litorirhabdus singularis TaxID=2518993 RepID=A0ABT3TIU4_9GAMM|nr:low molecular weight phosphotyrosine protein phosphatase [Candidatus Litorirhabdus singularis]MCX2981272.1 low molecular weight phosphotyrosine protein phosphatase [Candidatus Litorirhabdus singularis]